jgi:inner membrane transporter RhtA
MVAEARIAADGGPAGHADSLPARARALTQATPPPVLLLLSLISIQIGAAIATHLFAALGTTGTVFFRLAFAGAIAVAIFRPRLTAAVWAHRRVVVAYGVTIAFMNWAFYQSIALIPLGVAVAVEFIGPLLVGVATSRRPRDLLWLGMAAAGIAVFGREAGTTLNAEGLMFALLAGAGWAGFIIASQRVGKVLPGHSGLALALVIAAVALLPVYLLSGPPQGFTVVAILAALGVAVLSTALPLSLEFAALQRMPARMYSVLVTFEPVLAGIVGFILLSQPLDLWTVAGMLLVIGASLGVTLLE